MPVRIPGHCFAGTKVTCGQPVALIPGAANPAQVAGDAEHQEERPLQAASAFLGRLKALPPSSLARALQLASLQAEAKLPHNCSPQQVLRYIFLYGKEVAISLLFLPSSC